MATRSILSSYKNSISDIDNLLTYINNSKSMEAKYQYMISEVIMLRLFAILESTFSEIAFKLACGATYLNGNKPLLLKQCKSTVDAYHSMLHHNRNPKKIKPYLKWTFLKDIEYNIKNVLDLANPFYQQWQIYNSQIDEMRIIRNHIAHKNTDTKQKYNALLKTKLNPKKNLPVGVFLTSVKRNPRPNIETYLLSSKIILYDLSKG